MSKWKVGSNASVEMEEDFSGGLPVSLSSSCSSSIELVRDEEYYFTDGNCILQAQNVLFNVHRTLLLREDSTVSTMLTLPQGTCYCPEGLDDTSPIVLQDTAQDLRSFLWTLYADPEGIDQMSGSDADIPKLLSIIRFSHKYCYTRILRWALSKLEKFVTAHKAPRIQIRRIYGCNTEETKFDVIADIVRVAGLCGNIEIMRRSTTWICELMVLNESYLIAALALADETQSNALIGSVYFELLARGPEFWNAHNLNERQRLRILSGHYHLVQQWDKMWPEVILPNFRGTPDEGHIPTLQTFWENVTASPGLRKYKVFDLRAKVGLVQQRLMYAIFDPLSQPEKAAYDCLNRVLRAYNMSYPERYSEFFTLNC